MKQLPAHTHTHSTGVPTPSLAHPCPQNRRQGSHHPACWPPGVPETVPQVPGTRCRSALRAAQRRAGLWAPRGSPWSSRLPPQRSRPGPAFPGITWCGGGSAPDAVKAVPLRFAPGTRRRTRVWGPSPAPGQGARAGPCAHPPGTLPAPSSFQCPGPTLPRTLAHRLPQGGCWRPLHPSPASHWGATGRSAVHLPKVTRAG